MVESKRFNWPQKYQKAFKNAKNTKERANVTVSRINHFIKTNGAE
jgi:hypothetical protein